MNCEHRQGDTCQIAADLAGYDAETRDDACAACTALAGDIRQQVNPVTVGLALLAARHDPPRARQVIRDNRHLLERGRGPRPEPLGPGVGRELSKLLVRYAITFEPHCPCVDYLHKLNEWGANGCHKRLELICGYWEYELKRQELAELLVDTSVRSLVLLAIDRAEP